MDDFLLWPAADVFKWTISSYGRSVRQASWSADLPKKAESAILFYICIGEWPKVRYSFTLHSEFIVLLRELAIEGPKVRYSFTPQRPHERKCDTLSRSISESSFCYGYARPGARKCDTLSLRQGRRRTLSDRAGAKEHVTFPM